MIRPLRAKTQFIKREYILVWGSVSLALIMDVLPLPQWGQFYWPHWTLLTVIYWGLAMPYHFNIKFAWFTGLLVDIIAASWLGQNALLYALTIYLTIVLHRRLRFYVSQQMIFVALISASYILITMWIESIRITPDKSWYQLYSVITTMFAWLWVYAVLRHLRRKFYLLFSSTRIRT